METTTTKNARPKRTPLGANRNVLTVEGIPDGYVGRWVNDIEDKHRLQKALEGGYDFVKADGTLVGDVSVDNAQSFARKKNSSVVSKNVGNGVVAYLMAIRKEFYEEDQDFKAQEIADRESEMFRQLNSGDNGTYGGVKKA